MKKTIFSPTLQARYVNPELWGKIERLNLNLIRDRMILKHKWPEDRTDKAIEEYRKYLYMTQMFEESLSPSGDVDVIWHEHILHTNKYQLDCQKIFGKFLHHFPTPAKWLKEREVNTADCGACKCDAQCEADGNCAPTTGSCDNSRTANNVKQANGSVIDFDNPVQSMKSKGSKFSDLKLKFFHS